MELRIADCGLRIWQRSVRRGVILPIILLMLVLVGLLAASFAFHINARLSSTRTSISRLQTRLAAESCVEKVKLMLRDDRMNMNRWYDNQEELHRIIIWKPGADESVWDTNEEFEDEPMVYRCSVVADDFTDDEEFIRFGVTDEASKLNLNEATREQLMILVSAAVSEREDVAPAEIVDAILDWRDADSDARTEDGDTEGEYYNELIKPYKVKNGAFDTIEELLLVKNIDGRILYGEDYDRNGLLTPNEDDGDERFPPDDGDGFLNLGLLPYITVHSRDLNVSNDERDRIALYNNPRLAEQLMEEFDDRRMVQFVVAAVASSNNDGGNSGRRGSGGGGSAATKGGKSTTNQGDTAATDDSGRPLTARDDPKSNRLAQVRRPRGGGGSATAGTTEEPPGDEGTTTTDDAGTAADSGSYSDGTGGAADGGSYSDETGGAADAGDGTAGDGTGGGGSGGGDNRPIKTPAQLLLDSTSGGGEARLKSRICRS